jgi:hypothetical protein
MALDTYIHLISAPGQCKADFTNRLGRTYEFGADARIFGALRELSLNCEIENYDYLKPKSGSEADRLRLAVSLPIATGNRFVDVPISEGHYDSQTLVGTINSTLAGVLGLKYKEYCRLYYNYETNRIEFFLHGKDSLGPEHCLSLVIFPSMTKILGLQSPTAEREELFLLGSETKLWPDLHSHHKTHAVAGFAPTLKGFNLIMVYASMFAQTSIGSDLVQICDIVPKVKCSRGAGYMTYTVKTPKYIRLESNLRRLSEIRLQLGDEHGLPLKISPSGPETRATFHLITKDAFQHLQS